MRDAKGGSEHESTGSRCLRRTLTAFELQSAVQHAVAVAAVLAGELRQSLTQPAVAVVARAVAQGAGTHADQLEGSTFAQAPLLLLPHDFGKRPGKSC